MSAVLRGVVPLGIWKSAIENLKGDPSAGLAGLAIISGLALLGLGLEPIFAFGFPGGVYVLYLLKGLFDNQHERRMAEFDVQRLEAERGRPLRQKTQKALTRRRTKNGKS